MSDSPAHEPNVVGQNLDDQRLSAEHPLESTEERSNNKTVQEIEQEIARLKQNLAHRKRQTRPLSHSVATAYKLAIATCEKTKNSN